MAVKSEDVARCAGVSRSTVSQILNGQGRRFSTTTRERVEAAARDLNYAPSVAGRTLARGASDIVIALVPNTTFGGNLQDIFEAATERLEEAGLTLVLRLSTQISSSLDRIVAGMKPRAVLSLQPFSEAERRILNAHGIPSFDTSVGGDLNYEIGRIQANHLIERGYRRLAFAYLRDIRDDPYGPGREEGVRAACREHGIGEPTIVGLGIDLTEAGRVLGALEPRIGLACYNDDVAITVLTAAQQRSWDIPGDIGLCGMDHTPLSRVTNPRLTTVGYDLRAVATYTAASALAALDGASELPEIDIDLRVFQGGTT